MKVNMHRSVIASSSCGWNTLIKKSSRKDVRVLITISESVGTISLRRDMKDREGGSKSPILNTLGLIKSLCPVPEWSLLDCNVSPAAVFWPDFETRPGTEERSISSNSSCSAFKSDFWPISDNLKIFCFFVNNGGPRAYWMIAFYTQHSLLFGLFGLVIDFVGYQPPSQTIEQTCHRLLPGNRAIEIVSGFLSMPSK